LCQLFISSCVALLLTLQHHSTVACDSTAKLVRSQLAGIVLQA
jgi:hypothetical protein